MTEDVRTRLALVLAKFRDTEPDHPMAVIEGSDNDIVRLTYGDLCELGEELKADRKRANKAARESADLRDLLDSTREGLEDLRERYADMVSERDQLSVELSEFRQAEHRRFYLNRYADVTGASGAGHVADGVLWPDGRVTIRWRGDRPSTVNWDCIDDAEAIHGHGGATEIVWIDERDEA